jgi:hypothetical protein
MGRTRYPMGTRCRVAWIRGDVHRCIDRSNRSCRHSTDHHWSCFPPCPRGRRGYASHVLHAPRTASCHRVRCPHVLPERVVGCSCSHRWFPGRSPATRDTGLVRYMGAEHGTGNPANLEHASLRIQPRSLPELRVQLTREYVGRVPGVRRSDSPRGSGVPCPGRSIRLAYVRGRALSGLTWFKPSSDRVVGLLYPQRALRVDRLAVGRLYCVAFRVRYAGALVACSCYRGEEVGEWFCCAVGWGTGLRLRG